MIKYNLKGAVVSPQDDRDYDIVAAGVVSNSNVIDTTVYPENFIFENLPEMCYNQGQWPMCVGFAAAYMKEAQEIKENSSLEEKRCSPSDIYADREDTDYQGDGMVARQALKKMQKRGVCAWSLFPTCENYPEIKRLLTTAENYSDIVRSAEVRKIESYYRITSLNEIKYTLMNVGPILIVVPSFGSTYWDRKTGVMKQGERNTGHHAMVIIGWRNNNELIIQNSWGATWGDNGRGYITYGEYDITEMWAVTDASTIDLQREQAKKYNYDNGEWILEVAPTCTTSGLKKRKRTSSSLTNCEDEYEIQILPPLEHDYDTPVRHKEFPFSGEVAYQHMCKRCGAVKISYEKDHTVSIWYKLWQWIKSIFTI